MCDFFTGSWYGIELLFFLRTVFIQFKFFPIMFFVFLFGPIPGSNPEYTATFGHHASIFTISDRSSHFHCFPMDLTFLKSTENSVEYLPGCQMFLLLILGLCTFRKNTKRAQVLSLHQIRDYISTWLTTGDVSLDHLDKGCLPISSRMKLLLFPFYLWLLERMTKFHPHSRGGELSSTF